LHHESLATESTACQGRASSAVARDYRGRNGKNESRHWDFAGLQLHPRRPGSRFVTAPADRSIITRPNVQRGFEVVADPAGQAPPPPTGRSGGGATSVTVWGPRVCRSKHVSTARPPAFAARPDDGHGTPRRAPKTVTANRCTRPSSALRGAAPFVPCPALTTLPVNPLGQPGAAAPEPAGVPEMTTASAPHRLPASHGPFVLMLSPFDTLDPFGPEKLNHVPRLEPLSRHFKRMSGYGGVPS